MNVWKRDWSIRLEPFPLHPAICTKRESARRSDGQLYFGCNRNFGFEIFGSTLQDGV